MEVAAAEEEEEGTWLNKKTPLLWRMLGARQQSIVSTFFIKIFCGPSTTTPFYSNCAGDNDGGRSMAKKTMIIG